MDLIAPACAAVAAYLIGSLSFAVIVTRAMRLDDPRDYGSGNPGATNVLRSGNKAAAVVTLLLDGVKGYIPVIAASHLGGRFGWGDGTVALVGLCAFLGHLWPVFFGFKGGKGVATAGGVLLGFDPWLGLATIATWLLIAGFFRYSSLAALVAGVFAPFYRLLIWGGGPVAATVTVLGVLLIWRHRSNIQKLLAGTETRLGQRAIASPVPQVPTLRQTTSARHGARR